MNLDPNLKKSQLICSEIRDREQIFKNTYRKLLKKISDAGRAKDRRAEAYDAVR